MHSHVTEQPKIYQFCLLESLGVVKIQTLTLIYLWAWSKALSSCNLVAFHFLDWRLICSSRVQLSTSSALQVWRHMRRSNQLVCAWGKKRILNVLLWRGHACQIGVWLSCSSLQTACKFSSEPGQIKSADSQGREGFGASLMYAARWDRRWIVMEVKDWNGVSLRRIKEEELLTGECRGEKCGVKATNTEAATGQGR